MNKRENMAALAALLCGAAAAGSPMDLVEAALAEGVRRVVVPKGDYRLELPAGRGAYFRIAGAKDVEIDFSGSRLWGTSKARMFDLLFCTNVTVRNVTVDYPFDLPFTQGEIVAVDSDKSWTVRIIDGYPRPAEESLRANARGTDTPAVWPVQAYSRDGARTTNFMRFRDGLKIERLGEDTYRVSGGQDRRGDVGDIAVWKVKAPGAGPASSHAFCLDRCAGCLLEDCTVFATPDGCGFVEFSGDGNTYRRCRLDRCPPEADPVARGAMRMRSGSHDAFNSRRSFRGPTLDGCRFAWHCDDCVNISGFWAVVTAQRGRTLRVCPFGGHVPCDAGDTCQLLTPDGRCPPDIAVVSCRRDGAPTEAERKMLNDFNFWPGIADGMSQAYLLELGEDAALPPGSLLISNNRMGNGFSIRNCAFGPNRARGMLVKASNGTITGNTVRGVEGWGLMSAPETVWLEGGCSRALDISGNVFEGCGPTGYGGGILVTGGDGAVVPLQADSHRDIRIVGNHVSGRGPAVMVDGCTNLVLADNVFDTADGTEPVVLSNCENVSRN